MTKQEKLQAEAAIYGLNRNNMPPQEPQLSYDEIERMRAILQAHDKQNQGGTKEFDLNNPPKVPYTHQPFPQLVYHNAKREHKVVNNPAELKAALDSGEWNTEFYGTDPSGAPLRGPADAGLVPQVEPGEAEEIAQLDKIAHSKRRP
jgi:hypothetical protein